MSLFSFFRKVRSPALSSVGGSAQFQDFYRHFIAPPTDLALVRDGPDPGVIERLTPQERTEAERLLCMRLEGGGDSRAAIGLGLLKSQLPRAIDAVVALARDRQAQESARVDALIALIGMPSQQAVQAMATLLGSDGAYLVRYHSFKGLLMLHGHSAHAADDMTGALAPQLAGMSARPAAREAVQARLAELLAGRTLAVDVA